MTLGHTTHNLTGYMLLPQMMRNPLESKGTPGSRMEMVLHATLKGDQVGGVYFTMPCTQKGASASELEPDLSPGSFLPWNGGTTLLPPVLGLILIFQKGGKMAEGKWKWSFRAVGGECGMAIYKTKQK